MDRIQWITEHFGKKVRSKYWYNNHYFIPLRFSCGTDCVEGVNEVGEEDLFFMVNINDWEEVKEPMKKFWIKHNTLTLMEIEAETEQDARQRFLEILIEKQYHRFDNFIKYLNSDINIHVDQIKSFSVFEV